MSPQQTPTAQKAFEGLLSDPEIRRQLRKTLKGFGLLYFSHHLYLPPGAFHDEMISALESPEIEFLEIIGFRGCSKTTWGSLILPIYLALEKADEYPFILPIADTGLQAGINIANIKHELETNQLLLQDYGKLDVETVREQSPENPTLESEEEWQSKNILLNNGVRILARSRGQKIRGLKHRQFRPRAAVIDDPEDLEWVRHKENRDKTEQWLNSEVIPALDKQKRKLVILINNLHMDALASRVKGKKSFKVLEYSLVNDAGEWESCIWKAQYKDQKALDDERDRVGAVAWEREYKLKVVPEEEQIVKPEDIHYYDELPVNAVASIKGHGIDLAISQKEDADYTTIVTGEVFYIENTPKIFIRPNPFNEHVTFHKFLQHVRNIPGELKGANLFFVEDIGYQKAAIQEMERAMLPVVPMKPTTDKRSRLQVVAPYIKNGTVLFPRSGCEQLLGQIFNLGVESHDDLCLAGDTLVITNRGEVPIADVSVDDLVMTRNGLKRVLWSGKTGEHETISRFGLRGTPNHPVITKRGVIHLTNIEASDILYIWNQSRSCTEEKSMGEIRRPNSEPIVSISGAMTNGRKPLTRFIEICGQMLTDLFHAVCRSITRTAIRFTTSFPILSLSPRDNTCQITCATPGESNNHGKSCSPLFTPPQASGTDHQRDGDGTANTRSELPQTALSERSFAKPAESYSVTNIKPRASVRTDAGLEIKEPVYNLLVEDAHEFFANGILVHNCDGLTTLLQGLVSQGLELPKIHWIET